MVTMKNAYHITVGYSMRKVNLKPNVSDVLYCLFCGQRGTVVLIYVNCICWSTRMYPNPPPLPLSYSQNNPPTPPELLHN